MASALNIVNGVQLGNLIVPGVYINEPPPTPTAVTGPATNVLGIVGTATRGTPNVPLIVSAAGSRSSSAAAVAAVVGSSTSGNRSIYDVVANGAAPEANSFALVRVTDGTDTAASWSITDGTGFATGTVTSGGTWASGKTLSVTIGSNPAVTYVTGTLGDTSIATALPYLAAAINASPAVAGSAAVVQPVTASATALTVTALTSGTGGNSIALAASGTTLTLTAGGSTLTGGAAPGVLATITDISTGSASNSSTSRFVGGRVDFRTSSSSTSPVYVVSAYAFDGTIETFAVTAYATAGGGFSGTTFKTNLLNAINAGTSARAASGYWSATTGASTAAPLTGTKLAAAGGADGATGVTNAIQVGQDGGAARTGLYALRTLLQGGSVVLAGMGNSLADITFVQALDAFAQSEACIAIFAAGPSGTTPAAALTNLQTYNAQTRFTIPVLGEPYAVDVNTGLRQLENPAGSVAGLISSLPPWVSPLNKPKLGIVGSEWTVAQFPDETILQQNGIGYWRKDGTRFVYFGKTMGDGVTPIEDARMLNFIAPAVQQIGLRFIGKGQPAAVPNKVMDDYVSDIKAFLQPLKERTQISDYAVDLSPNTTTTITQHILLANISVQTLSAIWYVYNILQVGNAVQVTPAAG